MRGRRPIAAAAAIAYGTSLMAFLRLAPVGAGLLDNTRPDRTPFGNPTTRDLQPSRNGTLMNGSML
jgi:hypothetical protein